MQIEIYKNYQTLSLHAAGLVLATVKNNPAAVLCLATGNTPRLTYEIMAEKARDEKVDFAHCTFIALDEWVGIPPQNEGSCRFFLESQVFKPLQIAASQVHLFDALSTDPEAECKKMDKIIAGKGGIDLMLVGVGMNGHIGFNEPGVAPGNLTHVIELDDITQSVGQKYFTSAVTIKQGITLGLKHVLESKKLIMMANGTKKAGVIQKALEEEISNRMPASILRTHADIHVMIDEEAASLLKKENIVHPK